VRDGTTFVRFGCPQEALNTAGKCLMRRRLGGGRVIPRFNEQLDGACRNPAFPGLLQVIDAYADGGETVTDLLAAGLPAHRLVLHRSSMPRTGGCVTLADS
jgi:hypothetical protein